MTTTLTVGDKAPNFSLPTNAGGQTSLSDYKGKMLVLYFYPKDDTSGCTKQAIAFSAEKAAFDAEGIEILGVSKDTVASHDKFVAKHDLSIRLASDESTETCAAYGVWVEKNMYGRKYMGIERATFLIGADGNILHVWRKVKVPGHANAVMDVAKQVVA